MFVLTGGVGAALAVPEPSSSSASAEITESDCVLESSKEISYIDYLSGGASLGKDESVDAESFDLTTVEGIEDVEAVEVKSGVTVEEFAVDCGSPQGEPEPGEGDSDEGDTDDGTGEDGTDDHGADGAVITLSGCLLESSKDISYVEYFSGGSSLGKDESMSTRSFDLTTVEGIEDVDAVEVKASTTVQRFAVDCGSAEPAPETGEGDTDGGGTDGGGETDGGGTDGGGETDGGGTDGGETDGGETDEGGTDDGGETDEGGTDDGGETEEGDTDDGGETEKGGTDGGNAEEGAVITLSGCVVESTKDISNIEYFSGGSSLGKDESMNTRSFDLTTVEGIEDVDSIRVKSSTTVEQFAVDCG